MERHYAFESGYVGTQWLNAGETMEVDESGKVVVRPMAAVASTEQKAEPVLATPEQPEAPAPGGPTEPLPELNAPSTPDSSKSTKKQS